MSKILNIRDVITNFLDCPKCKSADITFLPTEEIFHCYECGAEWEPTIEVKREE